MTDIISAATCIRRPCAEAALPLVKAHTDRLSILWNKLRTETMSTDDAFQMGYLDAELRTETWPAFIDLIKNLPDDAADHVAALTGTLMGELAGANRESDAAVIVLLSSVPKKFIDSLKKYLPESTDNKQEENL